MTPAQKYENDSLDINALTAIDRALDDNISIADTSDANKAKKLAVSRLLNMCFPAQGRLTLASGDPCPTANQTAKTTLYYTPYIGNHISLHDGNRWVLHTFSELSLNISAYTASKPYDIWIYSNAGTPTLDSTVWTSDTARATGLALTDGVYRKDGSSLYRYLGTIRITGTTGQCEDSYNNRFVWNYYNRIKRIGMTGNTSTYWTYTVAAGRECNAGTGSLRFTYVVGVPEIVIQMETSLYMGSGAGNAGYGGTFGSSQGQYYTESANANNVVYFGLYGPMCVHYPVIGVQYLYPWEYCISGTITNYGYGSSSAPGYCGSSHEWEG
jgi:hypothetical protein